ncbi:hypothetical protein [Dyadobacter sp. LHD-138]|uniref:hypothetical protein n=1 Tax=Dyadobacter sp. LHD-138 TaxID=3071413 RepID=UPI0027E07D0B|nr:hypothetical protein [Dyadobacter sp. LHD-138]MDQ6479013.1 hypothetical protein [Dyadobacter sp. LHD-138]
MFEIYTISNFDREFKKLAKKYPSIIVDLQILIRELAENPFQGDPLGKDCYKVRMAITSKNKGKSGGSRIITYVKIVNKSVTLLSIYDKSAQNDIADAFLIQLLEDNQLL